VYCVRRCLNQLLQFPPHASASKLRLQAGRAQCVLMIASALFELSHTAVKAVLMVSLSYLSIAAGTLVCGNPSLPRCMVQHLF
jgi:hypothetical protein